MEEEETMNAALLNAAPLNASSLSAAPLEPLIYPSLKNYKMYTEFDTTQDEKIIQTIKDLRVSEFMNEKKKLEDLLIHYSKIKKRWTKADSILKITGITLGSVGILTATIIGSIPTLGIVAGVVGTSLTSVIVSGVLGGFSTVDLFLTETFSIGITSKKKKIYREICEKLELGINKLYLYQVKALSDNVLSNDEIEESIKIVNAIKDDILKIKQKDLPSFKQSEKIKLKENLINIKKEYKEKVKKLK